MNDVVVYMWRNRTNGKSYIGKGSVKRAKSHTTRAKRGLKQCPALYNAMRKDLDSFELVLLEEGLSDAEALQREMHYIATRATRSPAGYNLTVGGDGARGATKGAESRERCRQAKLGALNPSFGKPAANRGVSPTTPTRLKISQAHLQRDPASYKGPAGRTWTPDERARRDLTRDRNTRTAEQRARISEGLRLSWQKRKASADV